MNNKSIVGSGLVLALAACGALAACSSTEEPEGNGGTGGTNTAGAGGTGNPAGGRGGTGTTTGGASGSTSAGGTGGTVSAGTGGTGSPGTGGVAPTGGTGGNAVGGSAGTTPVAGAGGTGSGGLGGTGSGGAGAGGAGGGAAGETSTAVTVQVAQVRQEMAGFGINNNWAPAMTDAVADRLFGNGPNQLGMNILRIGMGTDGNPYNSSTYQDINKLVARADGSELIIGTLWSPPANCKDNNSIIDGGHLLPSCYESWSNTIAAFPGKVSANSDGELYAMSPQNEVDFASCGRDEPCNGNYDTTVMNGAEAAAFMKIVGPKLRAAGTLVMSVEASEWIHVWSNESACCSVPGNKPSSDPLDCGFPPTACPAGTPSGS